MTSRTRLRMAVAALTLLVAALSIAGVLLTPRVAAAQIGPPTRKLDGVKLDGENLAAVTSIAATEVLDRYIEAIGGLPNLASIETRVTHATMSLGGGVTAEMEIVQQRPNRSTTRSVVTAGGKTVREFRSGYDGNVGWLQSSDAGIRLLKGLQLEQLRLNSRLDRELRLAAIYSARHALPDTIVAGRPHHVLEMTTTFGTQELWYLDQATGLLTRTVTFEDRGPAEGLVEVTSLLEDYRVVDGVAVPFRTVTQNGQRTYTVRVNSIVHNATIEVARFSPPQAVAVAAPARGLDP